MKTYEVEVSRIVRVTLDETKFTKEFYDEFTSYIDSSMDSLDTHVEHLAWTFAAGRADDTDFIEGYGPAKDFGIKFQEIDDDVVNVREIKL